MVDYIQASSVAEHIHLYGSTDGSRSTGVYVPPGFSILYANRQTLPEYRGGSFVAFNGVLSLIVTHLANFTRNSGLTNGYGTYIGDIGGRGATAADNPNYVHAHIELVVGRVRRGQSTSAMPHISLTMFACGLPARMQVVR